VDPGQDLGLLHGHARDPQRYLVGGELVTTEIDGIGACVNRVVKA
jgi:acylpyruvate hydrolase